MFALFEVFFFFVFLLLSSTFLFFGGLVAFFFLLLSPLVLLAGLDAGIQGRKGTHYVSTSNS